jgi:hypothetical protein
MIKRLPRSSVPGQILTRSEMVVELRLRLGGRSMRRCGAEWGVDFHEISAVLAGDQYPGERLLSVLGLREESDVMYVRTMVIGKVSR